MIVDVHTRIWESTEQLGGIADHLRRRCIEPWERPRASATDHEEAMKPVNNALVLGLESRLLRASIPAEKVAQYVSQQPDKAVGFAGIDPTAGHPVRQLDRALQLGLRGVVLSPAAQGFHPADTRAMALYEACQARRVPIIFETGVYLASQTRMEFGQPALLDEVLRTFADLKVIITSLGLPWIDQTFALISRHPGCYAELSGLIQRPWQLYNALVHAHQDGVIDRLLLGSGFPFCTPEKAIAAIYSVNTFAQGTPLPNVPREQLRSIVERDALACLGLVTPSAPPAANQRPAQTPPSSEAPSARPALIEGARP